jgi:glutathione S-transferase
MSSPNSGLYLCGDQLTIADIQMSLPVQVMLSLPGIKGGQYAKLEEYASRLENAVGYKKAADRVEKLGEPFVPI